MTRLGLIASATIFALSSVILANAATISVSPGGTLQSAMDNANAGDTVQLSAGLYTTVAPNFFVIHKAITLAGAGSATILQVGTNVSTGLSINTSNVTVQNLTISAGPAMLQVQNVSNITLSGLTLDPSHSTVGIGFLSGNPISIGGSTNVSLSNVTLLGTSTNTVNNGLDIENSTSVTVTGANIVSAPRGAYVLNGQSVTIQSSNIYASSFEGILSNGGTNLTLDTVTVSYAGSDGIHLGTGSGTNNAIVRNSTVTLAGSNGIIVEGSNSALVTGNTITRAINQNGIWLKTAGSSVVEDNTIVRSGLAGINLDTGSSSNIVMANSVQLTDTQNCLNVANSDLNTVVANTLANCGTPGPAGSTTRADGILVLGGQQNRIERNTLTNYSNDGIVLTQNPNNAPPTDANYRGSIGNYVAKNSVTGYPTGSSNPTIAQTSRTGIWMNDGSNGTYLFGNTESVANEGGITIFNARSNIVKGNVASANLQAGILITDPDSPAFPRPANNVIQNNYVFNNPANGEILVRGADFTDIGFNFFSQNTPGTSAGINISSATGTGGAANHQVYRNIVRGAQFPTITDAGTTVTAFFENRFFFPSGTGAFNQAITGGDIKYDANVYLGGNFWSTFSTTPFGGGPSRGTPYSAFTNPASGLPASYVDRFPYAHEDLELDHSVTVLAPTASIVAAPGSMKTIAWRTKGCVLVDLTYTSSAGNATIVSGYPDVGIYNWTVPANQGAASNFTITVTCRNSAGSSLGTTGSSPAFTVPTAGLLLMTPGPDLMANAGGTLRVAWQRTATVGNVNVYLQTSEGGALTLMSSNQSGDFVDITLPSVVTSRAKVVIKATSNNAIQDSNDGYFSIRGTTPAFTNPAPGATMLVGDVVDLEWVSPQGSQFVDVELFTPPGQLASDPNATGIDLVYGDVRDYVLNIADRGRLTYFVPERWMVGAHFRLTFKDINGNVIGRLDDATGCAGSTVPCASTSPVFDVRYTLTTATLIPLYRMYLPLTFEHLYTTDLNEYNTLGTQGWTRESDTLPPSQILNGNYHINGIPGVPFYRVYWGQNLQHLWTTDRNEYLTLRELATFSSDHIVGYIFRSAVPGTTAFYRLRHNSLPIHLWTVDAGENAALSAPNGGWISEGITGYVYCSPGDTLNRCATALQGQSSYRPPVQTFTTNLPPLVNETFGWAMAALSRPGPYKAPPFLIHVMNQARMILKEEPIAPGEIVSLTGLRLGPTSPEAQQIVIGQRIPAELANVRVLFDGVPAPLLLASQQEIRVIVPQSVAGKDKVTVQLEVDGDNANPYPVRVAGSVPGLFTADGTGTGQAAALNQDDSPNSADRPAARGSIVSLYVTGAGLTTPAIEDGAVPVPGSLPKPILPVSVLVGGIAADVLYAGAAPGLPGVMQMNVRIPAEVSVGSTVPVFVTVGGASSQPLATIAVQ